jgi:hypothetical protein
VNGWAYIGFHGSDGKHEKPIKQGRQPPHEYVVCIIGLIDFPQLPPIKRIQINSSKETKSIVQK